MDVTVRSRPSIVRSLAIMLVFAVICLALLLAAADQVCRMNIDQWSPLYPGAELVRLDYDFVRPRAMGTTRAVYFSPDDNETVRGFYRENTLALLQAEQSRGLAFTAWDTEPQPDGGTLITLYSECGR